MRGCDVNRIPLKQRMIQLGIRVAYPARDVILGDISAQTQKTHTTQYRPLRHFEDYVNMIFGRKMSWEDTDKFGDICALEKDLEKRNSKIVFFEFFRKQCLIVGLLKNICNPDEIIKKLMEIGMTEKKARKLVENKNQEFFQNVDTVDWILNKIKHN